MRGHRRWIAAALVTFACASCSERSLDPREIPERPDLTGKLPALVSALAEAESKARTETKNPRAIGELGRLYHANHWNAEAARCYALARRLEPKNPRWVYLQADALLATGTPGDAPKLLEETVALAPTYGAAHLRLGNLEFKSGDFDAASAHFREALANGADSSHATFGLARIAVERAQWKEAGELLGRVLRFDPEFSSAVRLLANVRAQEGRHAESDSMLAVARGMGRFVPARDPWVDSLLTVCYDTDFLLAMADRSIKQGDMQTAASLFGHAMEIDPRNAKVHQLLAKKLYRAGRPNEAIASLRRAIDLDPESADARVELGFYLGAQNQPAEAERVLREAIALAPESDRAYSELGARLDQQGRRAEAVAAIERSLAINPRSAEALVQLGFILYQSGQKADALGRWNAALEVDPRFAKAHFGLGIDARDRGDAAAAAAQFQQAVRANPDYLGAHLELARAATRRTDEATALEHFSHVLRLDSNHREARVFSVLALARAGRAAEAIAAFHAIANPAAENDLALSLASTLVDHDAGAAAVPVLERLAAADPGGGVVQDLLGQAQLDAGNPAAARSALSNAIRLGRREPETYLRLALAQARSGQPSAAVTSLTAALERRPAWIEAANNLAWLLATCKDPAVRNGARAVALAKEAADRTQSADPILLDTLGAAYAAAGRFPEALAAADRALARARAGGNAVLVQEITDRRALYAAGRAFQAE